MGPPSTVIAGPRDDRPNQTPVADFAGVAEVDDMIAPVAMIGCTQFGKSGHRRDKLR
jgi:hypothetical protein